jgi:hypothetical protein
MCKSNAERHATQRSDSLKKNRKKDEDETQETAERERTRPNHIQPNQPLAAD